MSVKNITQIGTAPKKLPFRIYVQEFTAPYDTFRVDREGKDFMAFVKKERHDLAISLVEQLSKYIAPAEILPEGRPVPLTKQNAWLVHGTYAFTPAGAFFVPGAVVNAAGASLSGISMDRKRTTREITATLSEYCFQHGLISERRTRRPKKLGQFPSFQRPDFVVPETGP